MVGDRFGAIADKTGPTGVGRALAALAARQHGVATTRQLLELGLGRDAIKWRVRTGRLHPVHRAVYAVGHPLLTRDGQYLAAVLACGPSAALSHRSAAVLWDLQRESVRIDVTVSRSRSGHPGLVVHRSRMMQERDFTSVSGIRITTVARTLVDLAAIVSPAGLSRVVDRAERLELFDGLAIEEVLRRAGGRAGAKRLRATIAGWRPGYTRSELEERFQELVRVAGLPLPQVNVLVGGERRVHEVDCYWPRSRVVVALDGFAFHRTRRDRERDSASDADLELVGLRVVRLTWDDVAVRKRQTTARLQALL